MCRLKKISGLRGGAAQYGGTPGAILPSIATVGAMSCKYEQPYQIRDLRGLLHI